MLASKGEYFHALSREKSSILAVREISQALKPSRDRQLGQTGPPIIPGISIKTQIDTDIAINVLASVWPSRM
jgi:hypothetical protein